jgi:hypothetical protein
LSGLREAATRIQQLTARAESAEAQVERLREALRLVDDDVRHHLRSDEVHASIIRPEAIRAARAALNAKPVGDGG